MKIKRICSFFLCFILFIGMMAGCGGQTSSNSDIPTNESDDNASLDNETSDNEETSVIDTLSLDDASKIELYLAEELGFSMDKITQEEITGVEYTELLDKLISYAAPDKLEDWKQRHTEFRNYDSALNRYEAMTALYLAADTIGGYYDDFQMVNSGFLYTLNHDWSTPAFSGKIFDAEVMERRDFYGGEQGNNCTLAKAAYYFNSSRISNISGEFLFSYDEKSNSFKHLRKPTYVEAMLAVIRLISSAEPDLWQYEPGETDEMYLTMADNRREEIKNTVTDCTEGVTGTIYYISNNGNDNHDGKTPETAFETVAPLWEKGLNDGDAILFERGDEWYVSAPEGYAPQTAGIDLAEIPGYPENVTIGAYGEGEKPVLRGDIPEASEASFWTLYSDENGVKIWKSTKDVSDVSVLVFNEGEEWADSIRPYLSADKTYFMHADGEKFTLENALTEDMTFVWLPECSEAVINKLLGDWSGYTIKAPVYLRCDAGNPAEIYDEITLPQTASAILLNEDCSAYDLDIRYFKMTGIGVTSRKNTTKGQSFYNLAVGYCGGGLSAYQEVSDEQGCYGYSAFIAGGGIHMQANSDIVLQGCYVYHCGPMATILSMHGYEGMPTGDDVWENYLISDNLFEYCSAPGHVADLIMNNAPDTKGFLKNYVFENNIVMNSGYGWVKRAAIQCVTGIGMLNGGWLSAVENEFAAANNDGIYFRNNVFYRSSYALISIRQTLADGSTPVNMDPIFEGNTYVQMSTLPLLARNRGREFYYPSEEVMLELLGDKTGTVEILEMK